MQQLGNIECSNTALDQPQLRLRLRLQLQPRLQLRLQPQLLPLI